MNTNETQKLLEKIEQNRFNNITLQLELCDELYAIAEEMNDPENMGTAYFYRAEALFSVSTEDTERYANRSLPLLLKANNPEILARLYNLLGILADNRDDLSLALDYYLNCYKLCEKHHFNHIQGLCSCNIGVIYQMLEDYDDAINYFSIALECFSKEADNRFSKMNILYVYSNFFICFMRMDDIDHAKDALSYMQKNHEDLDPAFSLQLFEAEFRAMTDDDCDLQNELKYIVQQALTQENVVEFIGTYEVLCEFLNNRKEYDLLWTILEFLEDKFTKECFPRIRITMLKYRLHCVEEKRDFDEYLKWSKAYLDAYDAITNNYHHSVLESVNLRMYVEELKKEEQKYERKSMTDSLTQLYNRSGFHHYAEPLFGKAIINHIPVGFFIIDVDFFKTINDRYGHGAGDECLKKISSLLSIMASDDIIISRYGGDEFIVFTYGYTLQQVETMASSLKKQVDALMIPNEDSRVSNYVTLSQGICYNIPFESDTILDFMRNADSALYDVKEASRNAYKIV